MIAASWSRCVIVGLIAFARGRAHHRGDDVGAGALGRIGAVTRLARCPGNGGALSSGRPHQRRFDVDAHGDSRKRFTLPAAYTILFTLIVLTAAATWIVPAGTL